MKKITEYISDNFGLDVKVTPITSASLIKLPLYLKYNFQYADLVLFGNLFILAAPVEDIQFTPEQLNKHAENIKRVFNQPVIFVLENLDSWQRKRMLRKQIAFIQPGKQLYVPSILLDLNDIMNRNAVEKSVKSKLTSPAQFVILYHLQIQSLEDLSYLEIAVKLKYSKMTISRIVREFSKHNLITIHGSKEKYFKFKVRDKKQLWLNTLPLMNSPIKQVLYTDKILSKPFLFSSETALSKYSMLSESKGNSYAIWKDAFRRVEQEDLSVKTIFNKNYGINRVEIWNYDPDVLSNGRYIDRLSLYLTMKDHSDERVKGALEEILNQIAW